MFFRCKCGKYTNYGMICVSCHISDRAQDSLNDQEKLTIVENNRNEEKNEEEYNDSDHDD